MIDDWNYYTGPAMGWGQVSERDRKAWSHESESRRKAWNSEPNSDRAWAHESESGRKASTHESESGRKASTHEFKGNLAASDHEFESKRKASSHTAAVAVPAGGAHLPAPREEQLKDTDNDSSQIDGDSPHRYYAVVNSGLYDSVRPNREKASPALYVIRGGKSL